LPSEAKFEQSPSNTGDLECHYNIYLKDKLAEKFFKMLCQPETLRVLCGIDELELEEDQWRHFDKFRCP